MNRKFLFSLGFLLLILGLSTVSAQSHIDWSKAEGVNPTAISSSLQQKLELLGQQTGIKPQIRWGFRTDADRAEIVARSYWDTSIYRVREDGSIVRRSDGMVMVARPGNSPHERGQAVDLINGSSYTAAQLNAAGLRNDPTLDEPWHIIER